MQNFSTDSKVLLPGVKEWLIDSESLSFHIAIEKLSQVIFNVVVIFFSIQHQEQRP
jgi:hypothetical protein